MNELLQSINWAQVIDTIWAAVLLPIITCIGARIMDAAKARQLDGYADILYRNVVAAVKDVYETTVKDLKGTDAWTPEKQAEVKEIAKAKAIHALTRSAYQCLSAANSDFEQYLDGLIGTALYDLKNNT